MGGEVGRYGYTWLLVDIGYDKGGFVRVAEGEAGTEDGDPRLFADTRQRTWSDLEWVPVVGAVAPNAGKACTKHNTLLPYTSTLTLTWLASDKDLKRLVM